MLSGAKWQIRSPTMRNSAPASRLDISGLAGDRKRAVAVQRKPSGSIYTDAVVSFPDYLRGMKEPVFCGFESGND